MGGTHTRTEQNVVRDEERVVVVAALTPQQNVIKVCPAWIVEGVLAQRPGAAVSVGGLVLGQLG